ncbi:hypothetical protein SAMN05421579_1675 [Xenorhabdus japonica]|uniref:Uncharacterized protein n=1 Tax=Xenorhabdus japonica TaxID=53341 RepID=A0A1I5EG37_9GAMM|nr:hypothetical protein SAMN05421579_1675 [Xenorhabdus japonica]
MAKRKRSKTQQGYMGMTIKLSPFSKKNKD